MSTARPCIDALAREAAQMQDEMARIRSRRRSKQLRTRDPQETTAAFAEPAVATQRARGPEAARNEVGGWESA